MNAFRRLGWALFVLGVLTFLTGVGVLLYGWITNIKQPWYWILVPAAGAGVVAFLLPFLAPKVADLIPGDAALESYRLRMELREREEQRTQQEQRSRRRRPRSRNKRKEVRE